MHYQESVLENETHKLRWDFEIQTGLLMTARRPNQVIEYNNNKKKKKKKREKEKEKERACRVVDFADLADYWVKLKESEKRDKY